MTTSPLSGVRVLVTRPRHQAASLSSELARLGADAVEVPLIVIEPPVDFCAIDGALQRLDAEAWLVITSANAVETLVGRAARVGVDLARARIAVIGTATADALSACGLRADYVPPSAAAEQIADGLGDLRGKRILLAQADIARSATIESLRARGAIVERVVAYRTTTATDSRDRLREELERGIDVVTFMSGSAVTAFVALGGLDHLRNARIACIGDHTADAAHEQGLKTDIVSTSPTSRALAEAIAAGLRTYA